MCPQAEFAEVHRHYGPVIKAWTSKSVVGDRSRPSGGNALEKRRRAWEFDPKPSRKNVHGRTGTQTQELKHSPGLTMANLPTPEPAKALTRPADHSGGLVDRNSVLPSVPDRNRPKVPSTCVTVRPIWSPREKSKRQWAITCWNGGTFRASLWPGSTESDRATSTPM